MFLFFYLLFANFFNNFERAKSKQIMLKVNLNSFSYLNESILENIAFEIKKGTQLSLIGESGCGKSSLLKIIYGLLDCDNGTFFWNNIQILGPKFHLVPGMPFMKYLAQDFDLMPFITVG